MAANGWVVPSETETVGGVIVIEVSWSTTVTVVEAVSPPMLAEITLSPVPVVTVRPDVDVLIVATLATEEVQVTLAVRLVDVPLL